MNNIYIKSHQHKLSHNKEHHSYLRMEIERTKKLARSLTPAGQRLLMTLHRLYEDSEFNPVDRRQIASALGRPNGLTVWDRELIDRLCHMKFISCSRKALPTYVDKNGVSTGRGAKLVYSMDLDTGWRLSRLLRKTRR